MVSGLNKVPASYVTEQTPCYDVLVIGGGINGAGIAADAAGRGLSVALCEMADLASATSSASTKLIHGGLRYLENYEFNMVRKALAEREVQLRNAPHIIKPMRFRLPHQKHLRPRWMLRAGLFLYDNLSRRKTLPASSAIQFDSSSPLLPGLKYGFEYSDAFVDDARLVVLNAMQAMRKGADIFTRTQVTRARWVDDAWQLTIRDWKQNDIRVLKAKVVVNAAGPWVEQLIKTSFPEAKTQAMRLVKGSHIIVPRMYEGEHAYLLQTEDGRVVFVIPYHDRFSLIGTTDQNYTGDPEKAELSNIERDYLLDIVNAYFKVTISEDDIVSHFAGVRPLIDEEGEKASKVSRDYKLEMINGPGPILNVLGGKLTTYRLLAEDAMQLIKPVFSSLGRVVGQPWTENGVLPGGDFSTITELESKMRARYPWLPTDVLQRWLISYGTLMEDIVDDATTLDGLGENLGHGLYAREVDYLIDKEWAIEIDDILWRRSKLGLLFTEQQVTDLQNYLDRHHALPQPASTGTAQVHAG